MALNPQPPDPQLGERMSVDAYLDLDGRATDARYEYLDGVARLMSGGSREHDIISRNTINALADHFHSGPCFVHGSDMQVSVGVKANGKEGYVYPDATVSCDVADRRRGNMLIRSPRIVVEVLSPSTEKIDRGRKLEAYKQYPTIAEIVLINQFAQHVEVYRRDGETWSHMAYSAEGSIELVSVDVALTMAEIYKGIDFNEPLDDEELHP